MENVSNEKTDKGYDVSIAIKFALGILAISFILKIFIVVTGLETLLSFIFGFFVFVNFGYWTYKLAKKNKKKTLLMSFLYYAIPVLLLSILSIFGDGLFALLILDLGIEGLFTFIGMMIAMFKINHEHQNHKFKFDNLLIAFYFSFFSLISSELMAKAGFAVLSVLLNPVIILIYLFFDERYFLLVPITFAYYFFFIKIIRTCFSKFQKSNKTWVKILFALPIVLVLSIHIITAFLAGLAASIGV